MKSFAGLVLSLFILSAVFDLGSAIKCYVCTTNTGDGNDCEVHVENVTLVDCIEPASYCLTVIVADSLVRGCGINGICDQLPQDTTYCDTCDTDLCNTNSGEFVIDNL